MKNILKILPVLLLMLQACFIDIAPTRQDSDGSERLTVKDSVHLYKYSDSYSAEVNEPEALPLVELDSAALAKIINQNEKVVVYLWATWCAHCIFELPERVKFADSLEQNGVPFIFVSTNYEVKSLRKYMWKSGYRKPVYILDDGYFSDNQINKIVNFRRLYGLEEQSQTGLPQYFVFRNGGLIRGGYKDEEMKTLLGSL